jgi:hypothetical protein
MSPRQTRHSSGAENTPGSNGPTEPDSDDEYEAPSTKPSAKKPRKKAGTSKQVGEQRRVKGVRGKLKMLTEMPLDVLFEVSFRIGTASAKLLCLLGAYIS